MRLILLFFIFAFWFLPDFKELREQFLSDFSLHLKQISQEIVEYSEEKGLHDIEGTITNILNNSKTNDFDESSLEEYEKIEAVPVASEERSLQSDSDNNHGLTSQKINSHLYQSILEALREYKDQVFLKTMNSEEVFRTFKQVLRDHPEIFYVQTNSQFSFNGLGLLKWKLAYSEQQIKEMEQELQLKSQSIINTIINHDDSDLVKVKAIHDFVVNNTQYDYESFLSNSIPHESFTSYGSLILGTAVCEGYTEAIQLLLNHVGIENRYVTGKSRNQNHAWNMVRIDNEWYYLDGTWNDPVTNNGTDILRYEYFLVDEKTLAKDHTWDKSLFPKASSSRFTYLQDMVSADEEDGFLYFSSRKENEQLFKMKMDGTNKTKLTSERALYPVVMDQWVYFSNYSDGGYLYRVGKNGENLERLNDFHTVGLRTDGQSLFFIAKETEKIYRINGK